jgi:hypothetical protein
VLVEVCLVVAAGQKQQLSFLVATCILYLHRRRRLHCITESLNSRESLFDCYQTLSEYIY